MKASPVVGIVVGSPNDLPRVRDAGDTLDSLGVPWEVVVASAHRSPAKVTDYAAGAAGRGLKVIIAGAGLAAHLPGVIAAQTTLPVIGVPLAAGTLGGVDALLATVQMPPGIPVGAVGIDGFRNAALLAAAILAVSDTGLARELELFRSRMAGDLEKTADNRIKEIWGGSE